ncbi:MAG: hypothetical protein JSU70_22630 [Phycisphaerales bacterium]|nr:MAG: hypothetical protein JSU70_22630 [Phycisphaerales bacterium]
MKHILCVFTCVAAGAIASSAVLRLATAAADESIKLRVVRIDFAVSQEGSGSVLAADVDGDSAREFVVTAPGHIGVYRIDGRRIWHSEAGIFFSGSRSGSLLPGLHAPGVQVADVDGDGAGDLLFLDPSDTIHILDARTGRERRTVRVAHPAGSDRWEALTVANLRGRGDRDLLLQTTAAKPYRVAHYVAAYPIDKLDGPPLWKNDHFGAPAHGPLRVADLDGDGRDEVCGFTILAPDGRPTDWRYPPIDKQYGGGASFHIDSVFVADVRPDVPGLEVVLLEEGRNYLGLVNYRRGLLWWETNRRQEPQNAAVGEFDTNRPGLEIWCRSRYNTHQKPWVFDAHGRIISAYKLDDVAPEDWTAEGVEEITAIHWTGEKVQLAAAKERHTRGDVCLFEPLTGKFVLRIKEKADRLYVADVTGDWREEIIVASGNELRVYENTAANPRPHQARLWRQQHYRRSKMTWDYYSP